MVLATSWGGTTYPWGSPVIIGLFAASAAMLCRLVAVGAAGRRAGAAAAAVPQLGVHVACSISLAAGFAMFGALSFLPLFLQVVHGVSPTISGVYLLPMVLGLLLDLGRQRAAHRADRQVQGLSRSSARS